MKKHIFGFMLFSLIVAASVFVFAFFYAPSIPPEEAVKPPVSQTETRPEKPYCYPKRSKDFSYEVQSANYYAEQGKLVTKVKLRWNGRGEAPKEITVKPRILTVDNTEKTIAVNAETLFDPFRYANEKTVAIESKFVVSGLRNSPPNLYIVFDFTDNANRMALSSEKAGLAEAFHILYVYGEDSEIKPKTTKIYGRGIPQ